jgi:hypothetical protein
MVALVRHDYYDLGVRHCQVISEYILKPNPGMGIRIPGSRVAWEFCLRKDRTFARLFVHGAWQRQGTV